MSYYALFIGNFQAFSVTLNAPTQSAVIEQLEKLYSFSQNPMHVELYSKNKQFITNLYPFKLRGYLETCPYGHNPYEYYDDDDCYDCPHRKYRVVDCDEEGNVSGRMDCCLSREERYVFAPTIKSAKKRAREIFKIPISTTKL